MKVARNIFLLLLFIAAGATAAFAQDPVGELELIKGVVKVRRGVVIDSYIRSAVGIPILQCG